jgi:signal transduction histidine kinase
MMLSLRSRIVLNMLPMLVLFGALGAAVMVVLYHLGGRIDAILRENYDSVLYMEQLGEAVERIDSSFQFALAGREDKARQQYEPNWDDYRRNLEKEQNNITLPGEAELVERLTALTATYQKKGDAFYARPARDPGRETDYFDPGGLLDVFKEIKDVSVQILHLNEKGMQDDSTNAKATARNSLIGFGTGLAALAVLGALLAWWTINAILHPIRAVTQSALGIGRGDLDQVVPVLSHDELGQLAEAFNGMARQLRHYRQSDYSRLLRAQRTSQATIDSFPAPVLVVDGEGQVEMANPLAQRLFGVTAGGDGRQAVLPWQAPEALRGPLREAVRDQRPYLPEGFDQVLLLAVDGKERAFLPRILPINDPYGQTLGAAVTLIDVTRYRLLDQVKSDLVATVSHELKTPLTGLRMALHLLLEEAVGPLTPKQTELLLDARENAERLLGMVNNLLDLARLEQRSRHLDARPENPRQLLESAAEEVRPRAADKDITLSVEAPADLPPVAVDARLIGHVLGNLLDNALAYTDRGGRITLGASADGSTATLSVADTGRGIPPEYLPHVFEKFFRIPGQSRDSSTGLGLAISREIIQAHGGNITCESRPGEGTVFRIRLPVGGPP